MIKWVYDPVFEWWHLEPMNKPRNLDKSCDLNKLKRELNAANERIKRLEEAAKPKLKGRRCISSEVQNAIAELPDNISNHSASRRFGVSITTVNKYRQSQRKSQ